MAKPLAVLKDCADPEFYDRVEDLLTSGSATIAADSFHTNVWCVKLVDDTLVCMIDTTPGDEDFETNMEIP